MSLTVSPSLRQRHISWLLNSQNLSLLNVMGRKLYSPPQGHTAVQHIIKLVILSKTHCDNVTLQLSSYGLTSVGSRTENTLYRTDFDIYGEILHTGHDFYCLCCPKTGLYTVHFQNYRALNRPILPSRPS